MHILPTGSLPSLLAALSRRGYRLIGPVLREGTIVLEEIESDHQLPRGYVDRQAAGRYRLDRTGTDRLFDYTCGPTSYKRYLHAPEVELFRVRKDGERLSFEATSPRPARPLALIGARACDLAAIAIQDRVLLEHDAAYRANRQDMFVLAVQCGRSGELCFCASTHTGPRAARGFDLALTELTDEFLVEVGSERGLAVLEELPHRKPEPSELAAANRRWEAALRGQQRHFEAETMREELSGKPEHRRWKEVADRCLTCGNCTMVCPTCFCTATVDGTEGRKRVWDSCFTLELSRLHEGPVRSSPRARYRQWMTHKLSSWHDQFGTAGCVGCGRCATWCPAEIDFLEEARAICESPQ